VLDFGVAFADYDNDGYKDMLQVNAMFRTSSGARAAETPRAATLLFHNQHNEPSRRSGGKRQAVSDRYGRGCAWGDIDNDGRPDILILNAMDRRFCGI